MAEAGRQVDKQEVTDLAEVVAWIEAHVPATEISYGEIRLILSRAGLDAVSCDTVLAALPPEFERGCELTLAAEIES